VPTDSPLSRLRTRVETLTNRAYVPFSETPTAAALLLDDGGWIPGVRIESASYSLTLPALLNAYTTAISLGCATDIVAFVLSRPFRREETLYVDQLSDARYETRTEEILLRNEAADPLDFPLSAEPVSCFVNGGADDLDSGLSGARTAARSAHVPHSNFRVGVLFELEDGGLLPGANVEHPDWARILCAERNALGTMCSYAVPPARRVFLSCLDDSSGTPCGACRQLLSEHVPDATLWMDRHDAPPETASISDLLPGSFQGRALLRES